MPLLEVIPERTKAMRDTLPIHAWAVEDGCVFNLQMLMAALGLTEQSTKEWCSKHNLRPIIKGRTWLFTGRIFREQLEAKCGR